MIRVKGEAPAQEVPEEEIPVEEPQATPVEELAPKASMEVTFMKVPPASAGYRDPKQGPFMCANCHYYEDDGSCTIVDGPIDPEGFCNIFVPNDGDPMEGAEEVDPNAQEPMPEGEPYPEEPLPEEEPV